KGSEGAGATATRVAANSPPAIRTSSTKALTASAKRRLRRPVGSKKTACAFTCLPRYQCSEIDQRSPSRKTIGHRDITRHPGWSEFFLEGTQPGKAIEPFAVPEHNCCRAGPKGCLASVDQAGQGRKA